MAFHSKYICQQCGYESTGWMGKCPECGTWNSLVETVVQSESKGKGKRGTNKQITQSANKPINLSDIKSTDIKRTSTKISEFERVLGGGIVPGQVILIAGSPGIGKSTLLLEVADKISGLSSQLSDNGKSVVSKSVTDKQKTDKPNSDNRKPTTDNGSVLYICGEESASQVAIRGQRIGVRSKNVKLLENTDVDEVVETGDKMCDVGSGISAIIVDSIQTMTTTDLSGMAGSVGQLKECASRLVRFAKSSGVPVFLVGHVTKEGTVAGPSVLAHIVDTVLWFEGDSTSNLRILRSIKNRFGPTDEVGIFEMVDSGLKSVEDSQKIFLTDAKTSVSGSAIASVMQGTRPILVEIQSLVVETKMAFPKRVAQGIDQKRLEVIIAVLIRRCGLPLYSYDVFVNVSGGIKVTEPGSDLAVALAIASSYYDKPLGNKTVAIGEVGLLGEIREVSMQEKRLKEAKRLGYPYTISSREYKYLSMAVKNIK